MKNKVNNLTYPIKDINLRLFLQAVQDFIIKNGVSESKR